MNCPVHNEPVRVEYDRNAPKGEPYASGFCLKCLKHYPCCTSTYNMDHCNLVAGHELPHRSPRSAWMDPVPWKETT